MMLPLDIVYHNYKDKLKYIKIMLSKNRSAHCRNNNVIMHGKDIMRYTEMCIYYCLLPAQAQDS